MKSRILLSGTVLAAVAGVARADLMGQDLVAEWHYPSFGIAIESHVVNVSAGIELTANDIVNDDKFDIDISGDTVSFIFNSAANWSATDFNGWYFADFNGRIDEIIGYELDSWSSGVNPMVVPGFTEDSFWANFSGTTFDGPGTLTMRVIFVPAPSAAAVLGLGMVLGRRRR